MGYIKCHEYDNGVEIFARLGDDKDVVQILAESKGGNILYREAVSMETLVKYHNIYLGLHNEA